MNAMKQRSTFAITTLILLALNEKAQTRTRLMQKLNLGYERINRYCESMVSQGLIKYNISDRTFSLTGRGAQVLELSEQLGEFIMPINQLIKKYSFYFPDQQFERNKQDNGEIILHPSNTNSLSLDKRYRWEWHSGRLAILDDVFKNDVTSDMREPILSQLDLTPEQKEFLLRAYDIDWLVVKDGKVGLIEDKSVGIK